MVHRKHSRGVHHALPVLHTRMGGRSSRSSSLHRKGGKGGKPVARSAGRRRAKARSPSEQCENRTHTRPVIALLVTWRHTAAAAISLHQNCPPSKRRTLQKLLYKQNLHVCPDIVTCGRILRSLPLGFYFPKYCPRWKSEPRASLAWRMCSADANFWQLLVAAEQGPTYASSHYAFTKSLVRDA